MDEMTVGASAQDRERLRGWLNDGLDAEVMQADIAELEERRRIEAGEADNSSIMGPTDFDNDVDPDISAALDRVEKTRQQPTPPRRVGGAIPRSKPAMHPDVPEDMRDRWEKAPYEPLPPETRPERGPVPFPALGQPYKPPRTQGS